MSLWQMIKMYDLVEDTGIWDSAKGEKKKKRYLRKQKVSITKSINNSLEYMP